MKALAPLVLAASLAIPTAIFGQEDAARTNGLPYRIGGNRCTGALPGYDATVVGTLNVQGTVPGDKTPVFTVSLYSGGSLVSRQRVKNGGAYHFNCAPTNGASLVAELDSIQIAAVSLGQLDGAPMSNRHDIFATWSVVSKAISQRNEVISARQAYKRTDENQKLFDKAVDATAKKKTEDAAKLFKKLVETDPADFVAWYELGELQLNAGRSSDAAEAFQKSFALNSSYVPAAIGSGRANIANKKFDAAIEVLLKAEAIKPDSAEIHQNLGEAYLQNRKGSLAIPHMRKAIELSPQEMAELYLRIAALYHAAGGKHLAAEEYKLLLAVKPEHPDKEKLLRYIAENAK